MDKQIKIQKSRIKYGKIVVFFLLMVIHISFVGLPVYAQESFEVTGKCIEGQKVTLEININDETNIDGFDIYRADSQRDIKVRIIMMILIMKKPIMHTRTLLFLICTKPIIIGYRHISI